MHLKNKKDIFFFFVLFNYYLHIYFYFNNVFSPMNFIYGGIFATKDFDFSADLKFFFGGKKEGQNKKYWHFYYLK
jgi:hypothetical protein